ncbi:MAG: hypothetical protein KAR38_13070 [Calditrichia bacterium]|nr:hypothetical protein [Calditrichia bacterium]
MKVLVANGNKKWLATPEFYYSEYSQAYMVSPDIKYNILNDIYIAPIQYTDDSPHPESLIFKKMETKKYAGYSITFTDFETDNHDMGEMQKMIAIFEVRSVNKENENESIIIVKPYVTMTNNGLIPGRIEMAESDIIFELARISADDKTVLLNIYDKTIASKESLSIEISKKPLMSFVWLGTFLILLGIVFSMIYRKETNLS